MASKKDMRREDLGICSPRASSLRHAIELIRNAVIPYVSPEKDKDVTDMASE